MVLNVPPLAIALKPFIMSSVFIKLFSPPCNKSPIPVSVLAE